MTDGILSIQSHVAYGHVGNSAAVFLLQRLGFEVWSIPTVLFSNHTGYSSWRGREVEVETIQAIVEGLDDRNALGRCQALLSGYLGNASLGEAVLETLAKIRRRRADCIFACDPVMGDDDRGFFIKPSVAQLLQERIVPVADMVTPNHFELNFLIGSSVRTQDEALRALALVRAMGPRLVVATSMKLEERANEVSVFAASDEGTWKVSTPSIPIALNGTGDAFTALLLGFYLMEKGHLPIVLQRAVSAMFALVKLTAQRGSSEIELIAVQDQLMMPEHRFEAVQLQ